MLVVLDAGHYGKYNQSPVLKSFYESEFNWKMVYYMKNYFEAQRLVGFFGKKNN